MKKKKTQLHKLIDLLSDGDWHWTDEMACQVGHRFSVSVQTAREKGYDIRCERERSQNRYKWFR